MGEKEEKIRKKREGQDGKKGTKRGKKRGKKRRKKERKNKREKERKGNKDTGNKRSEKEPAESRDCSIAIRRSPVRRYCYTIRI